MTARILASDRKTFLDIKVFACLIFSALLLAALPGCTGESSSSQTSSSPPRPAPTQNPPGNLLHNPGFEAGREGWKWMDWSKHWVDFAISEDVAHEGKKSAYLRIEAAPPSTREVEIHGVVQEFTPPSFPAIVRGWYRVENWERGSSKQYLQFVAIVWGGHKRFQNYQIRHILAGATAPVYDMDNARYTLEPGVTMTPIQGQWVKFEVKIQEEFEKAWGMTPTGYDKLVFFFEGRYDTAPEEGKSIRADVYFDNLYVGDGS